MIPLKTEQLPARRSGEKRAAASIFGCQDVSKTTVAESGPGAAAAIREVDPDQLMKAAWSEKSEMNAAHGRPCALEGPLRYAYRCKQTSWLVDNEIDGGARRGPCAAGHRWRSPFIVFRKSAVRLARRFLTRNVESLLDEPRNCLHAG